MQGKLIFCEEKVGKWGLGFPVQDIVTHPYDQHCYIVLYIPRVLYTVDNLVV